MMVDQKQQVNRQQKMEKQSNSEHMVYLGVDSTEVGVVLP